MILEESTNSLIRLKLLIRFLLVKWFDIRNLIHIVSSGIEDVRSWKMDYQVFPSNYSVQRKA